MRRFRIMIRMIWLTVALGAAVAPAQDPTNAMFSGGSYDGWHRDVTMTNAVWLGGALVTLSSGRDQALDWYGVSAGLEPLTITDDNPPVIPSGGTLRVSLPAALSLEFDAAAFALSVSGTAAGKVNASGIGVSGDAKTLSIPVIADFAANDTLTLSGLAVRGMHLCRMFQARLGLDWDGDGATDAYDAYTVGVRVIWSGGACDGWAVDPMADYRQAYRAAGTLILVR